MGLKQGKIRTSDLNFYLGKQDVIVFRSSWEYKAFQKLEMLGKLGKIIGWSSEDVVIPYKSDIDEEIHRYYMDLRVEMKDRVVLVEIKPFKETFIPARPKIFKTDAQKRGYENHLLTSIKNQNKWKYTLQYCARMSEISGKPWTFQIWTEKVNKGSKPSNPFVKEVFEI